MPFKKNVLCTVCLFITQILLVCGCGIRHGKGEGDPDVLADSEQRIYYSVHETAIPDPDMVFSSEPGEGDRLTEDDLTLVGDTVYRIAHLWKGEDGVEGYLQILKPPYAEWISYPLPYAYQVVLAEEDQIFCKIARSEGSVWIESWREDGEEQYLSHVSSASWDPDDTLFLASDRTIYNYQLGGNTFFCQKEEQEPEETSVIGQIYGFVEDPQDGGLYWYGYCDQDFGIWSVGDGTAKLEHFTGLKEGYWGRQNIQLAVSDTGGIYLMDRYHLWQITDAGDEEPAELFDFSDRGYTFKSVSGMTVQEDGSLLVLAEFDGRRYILNMKESERPREVQEIVLVTTNLRNSGLQMLISRFNRQNDRYHVTVQEPENGEAWADFILRLQLELAAGRGPDIYSHEIINAEEMVRQGYLQSLEGILEDEDSYWPAALEYGRVNGVLYGIPVECMVWLAAYSSELTGGRQSWTLQEMMDAVRSSEAEILLAYADGCHIVTVFGLLDEDNKDYIDWEAGVSHLKEKPFLKLLEFAKQYADTQHYDYSILEEKLKNGEIAAYNQGLFGIENLSGLNYLEACFDGDVSVIGYPRSVGNGIYVDPKTLYLSAASDKREGAAEFFRFLLSEENQKLYVEFQTSYMSSETIAYESHFPVRLSALDRLEEVKRAEKEDARLDVRFGIRYQSKGLSDVQAERYRFIIENARPMPTKTDMILDIIYEELEPYFAGSVSAEEAARKLDNRVQLYLDERN